MTRLAFYAAGLALAFAPLAVLAASEEKIDVSGTWQVAIEIVGRQGSPIFTFKQQGDKLTGRYQGEFGEADVVGKLEGRQIEFSFEIQPGAKVVYTGTVEKDGTLKGKADYAGQAIGTWTAKRKDAED